MNIATINGSARPGNYTGKALALAQLVKYIYETHCPEISFEEWVRSENDES